MRTPAKRLRALIGGGIGVIALVALLSATAPRAEVEMNATIRRMGGPCLQLEQWGLFGWVLVGQTAAMTQATNGDWQPPGDDLECMDVEDRLVLVRLPLDARPDTYRICGLADDRACVTVEAVPFETSGPGP